MEKNIIVPKEIHAETLIEQAIQKGVPIETMERLLTMRRELKAEWAKEKFDEAMTNFQGECPIIEKTKLGGKTNAGVVAYKYAPLDEIVNQTKELLKKNGLSFMVRTEMPEGFVKLTIIVKHTAGHSESTDVVMPLGTQTNIMSASQRTAATITFAKRYAFCNAFGILTGDEDTDDTENTDHEIKVVPIATPKPITQAQKIVARPQATAKLSAEGMVCTGCGSNAVVKSRKSDNAEFLSCPKWQGHRDNGEKIEIISQEKYLADKAFFEATGDSVDERVGEE